MRPLLPVLTVIVAAFVVATIVSGGEESLLTPAALAAGLFSVGLVRWVARKRTDYDRRVVGAIRKYSTQIATSH